MWNRSSSCARHTQLNFSIIHTFIVCVLEKKTPNDAFSHFAKLERDRQTDRHPGRDSDRQTERNRQTSQTETDKHPGRDSDRQKERNRQRHRETEAETHCRHRQRDRETDTRTKKRHPRKQKTCSVFSISTSAASSAYMEISRNLA